MENNIKIETNNTALFIGAGFDYILGMPNWEGLVELYAGFIKSISAKEKDTLNRKIDLIASSNFSLMRKISMMDILLEAHVHEKKDFKNLREKFLQATFDYNNYKPVKTDAVLPHSYISKLKDSIEGNRNIKIITTNVSNSLEELGLFADPKGDKNNSFLALHGSAFSSKDEESSNFDALLREDEYIQNVDKKKRVLQEFLEDKSKIIIFGYSMNDFYLTKLISGLNNKKIIIFIYAQNNDWFEIQKKHYSSIFLNQFLEFVRLEGNDSILHLSKYIDNNIPSQSREFNNLIKNIMEVSDE